MGGYDVLVIGSGFGGAVAAARLAEAGLRVAILEKGAWRGRGPGRWPFPGSPAGLARSVYGVDLGRGPSSGRPLARRGLFELHHLGGVGFLAGVGVGGSSLVYGGVTQRPAPDFFDAFPADVDPTEMEGHLRWAEEALGASAFGAPSGRVEVLRESVADVPNARFELLRQAIRWERAPTGGSRPEAREDVGGACTLCNRCTLGCNEGAKQSTDRSLVARATARGAVVLDRHEVRAILRRRGGYVVECVDRRSAPRGATPVRLRAPRVVLAAGALHTQKILFRSRERGDGLPSLPASLGTGFSLGGDTLAIYRGCRDPLGYGKGHSAEAGILVHDAVGRRDHMVFPSELPFVDAWWTRPLRPVLDRTLILAGMGRDGADGTLSWRRGTLRLALPPQPLVGRVLATMDAVARRFGAPERAMKSRTGLVPTPRATVHPMGGCRMAEDPERGVVDARGEVFGYPGLFVADASILPRPPVAAPSLAIAAVASHVASRIVEDRPPRRAGRSLGVLA